MDQLMGRMGINEGRPRPRHPFAALFGQPRQARERPGDSISVPGYRIVKSLKTGGMSEAVNLVKYRRSGKLYVEKRVTIAPNRRQRTNAELRALKRMFHGGNVNSLIEFKWSERLGYCTFILEYCDGGDLSAMIQDRLDRGRSFDEGFVWHVLCGVAKGLAFMHHGIHDAERDGADPTWDPMFHLDVKPCNIFLSSMGAEGQYPRVVLSDFGCVIATSDVWLGMEHPRLVMCGTPAWWPPEGVLEIAGPHQVRYGPETDIWSLGATIHTMCRLQTAPDRNQILDPRRACGSTYSARLASAVIWCCYPVWQERPKAHRLVREVLNLARRHRMPRRYR